MVVGVIVFNLLLAVLGLLGAWQLHRAGRALDRLNYQLQIWEQEVHQALNPALTPLILKKSQYELALIRQRYGDYQRRLAQIRQGIRLLNLALTLGRRFYWNRPKSPQKRRRKR